MEKWIVLAKKADFNAIGEKYHIDPVVARLMRNREIPETDMGIYLHGTKADFNDPHQLKDVDKATSIIFDKIKSGLKIRILGDYDIDGINATYILYQGLRQCSANADYQIPDRVEDGYGLNERLVQKAYEDGCDTILTCDNGIAAAAEIALAKELGMTVVVTDHHEIPFEETEGEVQYKLPPADAVVNPKQIDCKYPYKEICGAVVAWKLILVLYEKMGISSELADVFLENAAFATVGDVMDLTGENRTIVRMGLKAINETKNLGMRMLIQKNKLAFGNIKAYHLGFVLGPCFNAGGRLDTAMRVMELLLETDEQQANQMAAELIELNTSRKNLTEQGVKEAVEQIEQASWKNQHVYVVYLPECHESIAGIIAGRLRERYCRPVFVITGKQNRAKGSGRSIEGYHMYEEMNRCSQLFSKFGGHALAAGFSIEESNISKMREMLNANETLTEEDLVTKVKIDMVMPVDYLYPELISQLELLEPFGKANPKPVFAERDATLVSARRIGKTQNMLKLKVEGARKTVIDAVYFSDAEELLIYLEETYGKLEVDQLLAGKGTVKIAFTYYPSINEYNGVRSLQIIITGFYRHN